MRPLIERSTCRWDFLPKAQRYPHNKLFDNWKTNPHRGFKLTLLSGKPLDDPYDPFYDRIVITYRDVQCYYFTHQINRDWRSMFAEKLLEMRRLSRRKSLKNQ